MRGFSILLLVLVAGCVLSGCVARTPSRVDVPAVAPTAPLPAETASVELAPVSAGLGVAQAKNVQLKVRLETGQRYSDMLSHKLAEAELAGAATVEELFVMRMAAEGLEVALATAKVELQEQWETLLQVMSDVSEKRAQIAASEQEKRTLREQVVMLNGRVESMHAVASAAETTREDWVVEAALLKGEMAVETRWKWNYFWWGLGMTAMVVVYVVARINRVLP